MLITGTANTLSTKLADKQKSEGIDGSKRVFDHPFFQALCMFIGEFLCLVFFYGRVLYRRRGPWLYGRAGGQGGGGGASQALLGGGGGGGGRVRQKERKDFNPIIFLLPACCDMTGTSCMYVGLTLTHASVFQMLRGSVVIFTGVFSVVFLGRRLYGFHWLGMALVLIGTLIVGITSLSSSSGGGASNPAVGNTLIVAAQLVVAAQMCVEEKFVNGKNIPALQAVGFEGLWGSLVLSLVLVLMYHLPAIPGLGNAPSDKMEDSIDAITQLLHNQTLMLSVLGSIFSIAFFKYVLMVMVVMGRGGEGLSRTNELDLSIILCLRDGPPLSLFLSRSPCLFLPSFLSFALFLVLLPAQSYPSLRQLPFLKC